MSASPAVAMAFDAWMLAALAVNYAKPCPDDLMNALVDQEYAAMARLATAPAATCDDLVLKLFPVLLAEFEPNGGDHPLVPLAQGGSGGVGDQGLATILSDLVRLSPAARAAMDPKWRRDAA